MQQTNPMRMERRRLADLIPAAYNPRKALTPEDPEYQDIKASIQGLGYADPIVINYDGTIIKGHQRRTVMMDMGIEEAEVVVLDIRDKAKEKMINVALNKITGKWDLQIMGEKRICSRSPRLSVAARTDSLRLERGSGSLLHQ